MPKRKRDALMKHNDLFLLVSRILISAIFLLSGVNKVLDPTPTKQYMAAAGMFAVGFFYIGAVLLEILGSLSLLLGYKTKLGTLMLILFMVSATIIFHSDFTDKMQMMQFTKNLAVLGGLFAIYVAGPGRISIDK